jgi:hypothetical protein
MYKTIEAIYKNGKIILEKERMPVKESRVLITILDKAKEAISPRIRKPSSKLTVYKCKGKLKDFSREDAYENRI